MREPPLPSLETGLRRYGEMESPTKLGHIPSVTPAYVGLDPRRSPATSSAALTPLANAPLTEGTPM